MREPYETLLGQYRDHWALWPFLEGDIPDFGGIFQSNAFAVCSHGEQVMLRVAQALRNGDRQASIADLAGLDEDNRRRVVEALYVALLVRA